MRTEQLQFSLINSAINRLIPTKPKQNPLLPKNQKQPTNPIKNL